MKGNLPRYFQDFYHSHFDMRSENFTILPILPRNLQTNGKNLFQIFTEKLSFHIFLNIGKKGKKVSRYGKYLVKYWKNTGKIL